MLTAVPSNESMPPATLPTHLVALVRAGAQFEAGKLVERAERAA